MSDQGVIPNLAPQPMVGPGSPPLTDGTVRPDIIAVTSALIRAIDVCAKQITVQTNDGREAKDFAQGALYLAQTVITLDPSRLAGGDHPATKAAAATPKLPPTVDRNHDGQIG